MAAESEHLVYLTASGIVELTANTVLVGHDGWADARFGDLDKVRRQCRRIARGRDRQMRILEWLDELRQDLLFALRRDRQVGGDEVDFAREEAADHPVLVVFEDEPHLFLEKLRDAAEWMECSAGSVKSYLFRARSKIRRTLAAYLAD